MRNNLNGPKKLSLLHAQCDNCTVGWTFLWLSPPKWNAAPFCIVKYYMPCVSGCRTAGLHSPRPSHAALSGGAVFRRRVSRPSTAEQNDHGSGKISLTHHVYHHTVNVLAWTQYMHISVLRCNNAGQRVWWCLSAFTGGAHVCPAAPVFCESDQRSLLAWIWASESRCFTCRRVSEKHPALAGVTSFTCNPLRYCKAQPLVLYLLYSQRRLVQGQLTS